ncbi:MAG: nucleotidyltransferase family protein [Pseudomonadota bacterium]|nr:nucleotidyltransferase family protein [Pseudomonadota bacterium]
MDAMLLAAGRGERMRPLSDSTPKPLLEIAGKAMIVRQIEALAQAGVRRLVINHAWLGAQIEAALGDGRRHGVNILWSREGSALGTAGGVVQALALLQGERLLVASADIHTDYDYARLAGSALPQRDDLAHLVLVDDRRVQQDFDLHDGRVRAGSAPALTYGNIGVFRRALFDGLTPGASADLGRLLRAAVAAGRVSGERHQGIWDNVGTPQDLERVNACAGMPSKTCTTPPPESP